MNRIRHTLSSCVLMNRASSAIAISLLWSNPFMIDNNINQFQYALLIRTYTACFTEIEKTYLENNYLDKILYSEPVRDATINPFSVLKLINLLKHGVIEVRKR